MFLALWVERRVDTHRRIAEAYPRNPPSTLGNHGSVLAGGEPNSVRSAARFHAVVAASAIDSASRAPSSRARQHITSQGPTPSGPLRAKPAAAVRYSSARRSQ